MTTKRIVPIVAVCGVIIALAVAITSQSKTAPSPPAAEPPLAPYQDYVGGAGIVEAGTANINVGSSLPGIVKKVRVKVGQRVRTGDVLFEIDDREYRAELAVGQGNLGKAKSAVAEALASLQDAASQYDLVKNITDQRAVSIDEVKKRQNATLIAQARVSSTQAAVTGAEAEVEAVRTKLERLIVRSPIDGEILQVSIHPGEYAQTGGSAVPLVRMGNLDTLHVRVDIDENDAWRFKAGAKAVAFIRGKRDLKANLTFVRIEPYVTPKTSLTGSSAERVDTRVLQVLYSFHRDNLPAFVGQQVDVYIDTGTSGQKNNDAATRAVEG